MALFSVTVSPAAVVVVIVVFGVVGCGHSGVLRERDVQLYCWQVVLLLVRVVQFGPGFL